MNKGFTTTMLLKNESQIKFCECGCGGNAPISKGTNKKRGYIKGQPTRFISGHNPHLLGSDHPNWTGGKVEVSCVQCGTKFFRKPSEIERTKMSFCSKKCSGKYLSIHRSGENSPIHGINSSKWTGGDVKVSCAQCGKKLYRKKSRVQNAKNFFCDSVCIGLWQADRIASDHPAWKGGLKEVACDQCGKILKKRPHDINKNIHHFCNKGCEGMWKSINCRGDKTSGWCGGISDKGYCITWSDKEFKEYIFERDGYRCQNPNCWGTSKRLNRHHIDYDKNNCETINIITVCTSCNTRANVDRDWHTAYYKAIMDKRFNIRRTNNEYSIENNIKGVEIWKENKAHSPVLLF